MDAAWSAPQGPYYHADIICLGSKGLMVPRVKPTPTRFPINSLHTPNENTTLCATRRVALVVAQIGV